MGLKYNYKEILNTRQKGRYFDICTLEIGITSVGQCLAQLTFHTVTTIHAHNEYILRLSISHFIKGE